MFLGGLAQLARAPVLHAGGHRFDSDILHNENIKFFDIHNIQQQMRKKKANKGRMVDALALRGEEGRDKLR